MTDTDHNINDAPQNCPGIERWKPFLDGDAPDAEAVELAAHLEDCDACQQTLELLAAGKETWEGTAKQLAEVDAAGKRDSSGPLKDVLDDLKQGVEVGPAITASSRDVLRFLDPSDDENSLGRLDTYEILEVVGAGGMGVVLRAWDPTLRRVVAIKVLASHLSDSAAARRRFVREAQAAAAVSHDHVVAIHAVASEHEPPYLVMQYIEGKTLQQRLDRAGTLEVREVLRIGQQTALGLAAAHRQGIVHRDIKPANILLENGVERVRITDFGLARAVDDASMTQSGVVAGTPLFMAPEQAMGQPVDQRSDLFSLGSVLYALCTGRPPFRSSTMMGVIRRVCDEQARPIREVNPDVPEWLCGIIERLLSKKPDERFQTADEVAELLAGCLAHLQQPLRFELPLATRESHSGGQPTETERPSSALSSASRVIGAELTVTRSGTEVGNAGTRDSGTRDEDWPTGFDADEIAAWQLVKWPAVCLFVAGLLNFLGVVAILAYLMAELGQSAPHVLASRLWTLLPCSLCMIGAIRMGSLKSRIWGYVAAVTSITGGPALPLSLPIGIWALLRLGRPEVVREFDRRSRLHRQASGSEPLSPSRRLVMSGLCGVGVLLMAFTVSTYFRMSSIAAASNEFAKLNDYADVRLVSSGIVDETAGGLIDANNAVRRIHLRLMIMMGAGAVMAFIGFRSMSSGRRHKPPELVAGFNGQSIDATTGHATTNDRQASTSVPPFGKSLAQVLITLAMLLISVAAPLLTIYALAFARPEPLFGRQLATMIGFGATAIVFGLIALLRRTFGKNSEAAAAASLKKNIMPQLRRVPEVVLCTFLAVITLGSIYNDLTASNYDWFMEATIIPLVCVTLVSVVLVAFVNLRRIRELEASGQKDEELATAFRTAIWTPVGILVPVLVLFGVWIYFQGTVGYVTYDVDDEWSNVAFRNTETGEIHERIAMWKRCRLKVGTYDWTVSDSELRHAILASGAITVQPRVSQVLSVHVTPEESLQRLVGLWKYHSGNAHWPSATVEALTRLPGGMAITRDGDEFSLQYHYPDGSAAESLLLEVEANSKPRRLRLLNRNSTGTATVAAQGIWSVSQNTLSLMLHSLDRPQLPNRQTTPGRDYVRMTFNKVDEAFLVEAGTQQPSETTEK